MDPQHAGLGLLVAKTCGAVDPTPLLPALALLNDSRLLPSVHCLCSWGSPSVACSGWKSASLLEVLTPVVVRTVEKSPCRGWVALPRPPSHCLPPRLPLPLLALHRLSPPPPLKPHTPSTHVPSPAPSVQTSFRSLYVTAATAVWCTARGSRLGAGSSREPVDRRHAAVVLPH